MNKPSSSDPATEELEEKIVVSDEFRKLSKQERGEEDFKIKKKYECDQCDKSYSRKMGLSLHIQSLHEGVKYCCDQCDYQSSYKGALRRHIQSIHEGIKYACNQCDYQSRRQDSLTSHIKSIHDGFYLVMHKSQSRQIKEQH